VLYAGWLAGRAPQGWICSGNENTRPSEKKRAEERASNADASFLLRQNLGRFCHSAEHAGVALMRFVHYPDPSPSHGFTIWIDWVCAPYESATEVAVIRPVSLDGVSFIETPIYLIYCLFLEK